MPENESKKEVKMLSKDVVICYINNVINKISNDRINDTNPISYIQKTAMIEALEFVRKEIAGM